MFYHTLVPEPLPINYEATANIQNEQLHAQIRLV